MLDQHQERRFVPDPVGSEQTAHAIELRSITKSFKHFQAIHDVTVNFPSGVTGLLGPNGAGKSTLIKILLGLLRASSGDGKVLGKQIWRESKAIRQMVGYMPEDDCYLPSLSGVECVQFAARLNCLPRTEALRRAHEILDFCGAGQERYRTVETYSTGMRQKLKFAQALVHDPALLILDEPTSVLPPQAVGLLFDTLRRLRDGGVSILFISHKLDEIRALCDRATILRGGRVTGDVDPREHDSHDLARMMIGRDMPAPLHLAPMPQGDLRLELSGLNHAPDDPFGMGLAGVTLRLHAGEILGIAGISGNGQAELSRLISGETVLPAARRDEIRMMDKAIGHLGPAERRALGFAFVPEERLGRGAVPDMSLADNSLLTAHPLGLLKRGLIDRQAEAKFTAGCIADFDVRTSGPEAEAGSLSGGNLQKFIMGREISLNPRLLFVAQPTWGVDIGAATAIRHRLVQMRNEGVAVLVISEELEELFEICDRIQVLHKGALSPSLDPRSARPEEIGRWMIGAAGVAA